MVAPFPRRHPPATRPSLHPGPGKPPLTTRGPLREGYLAPVHPRRRPRGACHGPPGDAKLPPLQPPVRLNFLSLLLSLIPYPSLYRMLSFETRNIPIHLRKKIAGNTACSVVHPATAKSCTIIDTKSYPGIVNRFEIQTIIDSYRAYDTSNTIYIFLVTDTCETYMIPENVRLYRTSLLASKKRPNEYVLPYIWGGMSSAFPPLPRSQSNPIVGFCGLVSSFRAQTLSAFQSDTRFTTHYLLRDQFWGGCPHHPGLVSDFEANMRDSHFNICNRGAGNFSMRFCQTLSAGRIPILLNTDLELPFSDEIDWSTYIVIANTEIKLVDQTWIFWNTRNISDAQTRCRELYDTYFAGTRYFDKVLPVAKPEPEP